MSVVREAARIYWTSLGVVLISIGGYTVAGVILGEEGMRQAAVTMPGLLLMVPGLMAMRGNVYGALGARIATALHQGLIEPRFTWQPRLVVAVAASLVNGGVIAVFLGVAAWLLMVGGGQAASLGVLLFVSLVSTALSAVVVTAFLLAVLFIGFRHGIDPDILNGPLVTSVGDIAAVFFVSVSVMLAGVIL